MITITKTHTPLSPSTTLPRLLYIEYKSMLLIIMIHVSAPQNPRWNMHSLPSFIDDGLSTGLVFQVMITNSFDLSPTILYMRNLVCFGLKHWFGWSAWSLLCIRRIWVNHNHFVTSQSFQHFDKFCVPHFKFYAIKADRNSVLYWQYRAISHPVLVYNSYEMVSWNRCSGLIPRNCVCVHTLSNS